MKNIREGFESFMKASYSGTMTPDQFRCLMEAYYAGAAIVSGIVKEGFDEGHTKQALENIKNEMFEWVAKYKKDHGIDEDNEFKKSGGS